MNTWFTSDSHYNHNNIRKYCNRPFTSVEEMNETITTNFNSVVREKDAVYHLGDFGFFESYNEFICFMNKLNGVKYFIRGNHDKFQLPAKHALDCGSTHQIVLNGQHIFMCHYPMYSHNKSHFNTWQLYGHHHHDISDKIQGKKMNVGVDVNNFFPIHFEQIKEYMSKREDNWDLIRDKDRH
jgi:calcineurin-like phosphoesterase family protein